MKELAARLKSPIEFQSPTGGRTAYGYPAPVLVDICNMILEADRRELTNARQKPIVEQAMILVRGLATVMVYSRSRPP